ncbi:MULTISPECIES: MAPEG family protein [unclassified Pseudomonas]|uniref:MAPEG family protein n=1 Tax=unclassified Pseudomonas TaxID=196821 RepID=UPI0015A04707|nr:MULTISPECIES: MAPEG family protein [unclassified Pseudomonas]NWC96388.1 MAPEG family protein [Pseudomonas sp. IPO3779]NWD18157.1 MAPEG family protein [Pseudomonas sp. IPO3778]
MKVYALCVLVLFIKMLAISCYQGYFRLRHLAFTNSEDAGFFKRAASVQELPQVSRGARAWANDLENIPLFFVLGGLCVALGVTGAATTWLFCTFTVARVMHTLMYLSGRQPWRTVAYGAGVACLCGLAGVVGFSVML